MTDGTDTRLSSEDAAKRLDDLERVIWVLMRDIRRGTPVNTRWASIALTHFQQGEMALRRALDNPWEQAP